MHWAVTALPNSKAKGTGFRSRKMRSRVQFSVSFHWTVYFCAIVKWEVERHTVPQNGPGSWIFGWCLTKDHRIWRSAPPYAPLWFRDDFVFVRFTGQKELCFKTPEKWLTPCPEQFPQSGVLTDDTLTQCWFKHICQRPPQSFEFYFKVTIKTPT